jgi:hypothetical protein
MRFVWSSEGGISHYLDAMVSGFPWLRLSFICECRQNQDIYGFHGYQVAIVTVTVVCEWCHNFGISGYGESNEGLAR